MHPVNYAKLPDVKMQFSEEGKDSHQRIQAYGDGWIQVQDKRLYRPCIISGQTLWENWAADSWDKLEPQHLETLFAVKAEVILIGTGREAQLPPPGIYQALVRNGIGFEVMATDAACRTYNVLLAENRPVVAAIFL